MGRILGMLLQNMLLDWGFAASVISLPAYSVRLSASHKQYGDAAFTADQTCS